MDTRHRNDWRNFERAERRREQQLLDEEYGSFEERNLAKDIRDAQRDTMYTVRHRAKRKITKNLLQ